MFVVDVVEEVEEVDSTRVSFFTRLLFYRIIYAPYKAFIEYKILIY